MDHFSYYHVIDSPLGPLFVGGSASGLHRVGFIDDQCVEMEYVALLERESGKPASRDPVGASAAAAQQLIEYFAGRHTVFDLPLAGQGTEFQGRVRNAMLDIPYGEMSTYGEIARAIGSPSAARAVGAAVGWNPLSIIVPCHRVVGSDGALTGYGGGLDRKAWLLALERNGSTVQIAGRGLSGGG